MKLTRIALILLLAGTASAVPVTDSLVIHLDAAQISGLADGAEIDNWPDAATSDTLDGSVTSIAGYGKPVYKTNVLNGLPVARFVRSQQDMLVTSLWSFPDPAAGITVFVVCTGGDSGSVERVAQIGAANGTNSHMLAIDVSTVPLGAGCRYNNGYALSSNSVTAGAPHVSIRQMAQSGRHDSLFYAVDDLDPETLNANNPANTITFDAHNNHFSIGNGMGQTGWWPDFYNGDLAEILVYNAQLSAAQMLQVGQYLADKYALDFGGPTATIIVSHTDGATTVQEGGPGDEISISLAANPTDYPVTIDLRDPLDPTQVAVSPAQLTFTSSNWQTPRTVTITAIDDDYMERATHDTRIAATVTTDPASPYYNASLGEVWVDIQDNDCGAYGFAPTDYNLDCVINLEDFAYFALEWAECPDPDPSCRDF